MSATVSYKGNTLTTVNNQTRVLNTSGKWLEDNITIVDVTQSGGGTPAISVVDTLDAKGGTVRTITALDISDTTATASDVAVGKYFYTSNGTKTAGSNSGGGGSSGQSATGTISGDGTNVLEISCNFEPDLIHVYTDMSDDASKRGVASFIIIKGSMSQLIIYGSANNTSTTIYEHFTSITGYGDVENAHGTYSNGTLALTTVGNSSSLKFLSGQTYTYELKTLGGGTPSATAHTIYFEFSDETNASIVAYYNDSFVGSAITATKPVTYGQKTVDSASLDGVEWYTNVGYEVLYNNSIELDSYDSSLYGSWLGRVADAEAEDGSEWRVTINNTVYDCLAENDSLNVSGDWSIRLDGLGGGQCMFYYINPPSPNITLKIERKVTA